MDLTDAADIIREKLIEHPISGATNLWSTILKQIRKQNSFDGLKELSCEGHRNIRGIGAGRTFQAGLF